MQSIALVVSGLFASLIDMNRPGHYIHWWFIQMSYANLLVIILMIVVFCAAILIPFKSHKQKEGGR